MKRRSVLDDIAAMLKSATRALATARKEFEIASAESGSRRQVLEQCEARVIELQDALAILRRELKPPTVPDSNVARLELRK
jgi:hypothetical protein